MALKGFKVPTKAIALPGGESFTVRGLSLDGIAAILADYQTLVEETVAQSASADGNFDMRDFRSIAEKVVTRFPQLAAEIIALAADEEDVIEEARSLPAPIQLVALEHIATLTFEASGGPKSVVEMVTRWFQGISTGLTAKRQSIASSVISEGK